MSDGSKGLRICIISGSSHKVAHAYGLHQDARIIEQILRELSANGSIKLESLTYTDAYTYGTESRASNGVDINIHLEVPCRMAWNYARVNIVIVNQEWWYRNTWDWVLAEKEKGGADLLVFKSNYARALFPELDINRVRVISWRAGPEISAALSSLGGQKKQAFLYLIGASANKAAAASTILKAWKSEWPPLHIYGSKSIMEDFRSRYGIHIADKGVELLDTYSSESDRIKAQAQYTYHIVASAAEGFGYTFAEAAAVGALPLWTDIGVYRELYGEILGSVGRIATQQVNGEGEFRDNPVLFTEADVVAGVKSLLQLTYQDEKNIRGALRHKSTIRIKDFRSSCRSLIKSTIKLLTNSTVSPYPSKMPVISEFPHVAIITLTYNRPRWFPNMANNILKSDYPPDKLTWIIADDSDSAGRVDGAVAKFQSANPYIRLRYLSLPKRMAIGEKRNKACSAAPAEASIFMMMDDDDHYPATSIRTRMSYLTDKHIECVYCSTLPMYDAKRYISAMNIPPLNLAPAERVSEASLAFKRSFFESGKFPASVNIAEGEGFIVGREAKTAEISPRGVIVSFLHGGNATSRRVPESTEANGCHYGFSDEFFTYISELAMST